MSRTLTYECGEHRVFCDGVELDMVIEACPEEGWAIVACKGNDGECLLNRNGEKFITAKVEGYITVIPSAAFSKE